jgi:hypothetical protein
MAWSGQNGLVCSGQVWSGRVWHGLVWSELPGQVSSGLVWPGIVVFWLSYACQAIDAQQKTVDAAVMVKAKLATMKLAVHSKLELAKGSL